MTALPKYRWSIEKHPRSLGYHWSIQVAVYRPYSVSWRSLDGAWGHGWTLTTIGARRKITREINRYENRFPVTVAEGQA